MEKERCREKSLEVTCEYLTDPMGIQNPRPRFAWKAKEDSRQISYRVQVWDEEGALMWDSGVKNSSKSVAVAYEGQELKSRSLYHWQVEAVTEKNKEETVWTGKGTFETSILKDEEWQAKWIRPQEETTGEAPLIRKSFVISHLPKKARLYVSGLGYCETTVNGKKVDDGYLDPGWTDYRKTVLYRTFDVGEYLQEGENVIAFELGEGWHGLDHIFFWSMFGHLPGWNSRPKLLAELWLDDKCICTRPEDGWRTAKGPVTANNLYDGERYDAGREKPGFNCPGYKEAENDWKDAVAAQAPGGRMVCQMMPSIGERYRLSPQYVEYVGEEDAYSMVVDFGQNLAGWAEIEVAGQPGTEVRLRYGEVLGENGQIDQRNLRSAKAEDVYVIGSGGKRTYHPRFTYHGFRYVQIEMKPGIEIHKIEAVQISTRTTRRGWFECSDPFVNKIYETVLRTEENNVHSVPTDCPQRDERLGWVNDMTVRYENAIYNFDMVLVYEKWMHDLMDAQAESGAIPDTAPYFFGDCPGSHVTSAFVLIPWCLYTFTGDVQLLARYYDRGKQYVNFKLQERGADGILPEKYYGEWAPPMTESVWAWKSNALPKDIPQPLVTTCYLYYDCLVMEKVSRILAKEEDALFFAQEQKRLKEDINRRYFHQEGYYGSGSQGSDIMPLFLGIVPEEGKEKVLSHLIENIRRRGDHLATGNQMTKLAYEALLKEGQEDLALKLTRQKTYPSVGYMLERGATTVWERWEYLTCNQMNSHDHPMLGAFVVWLFKGLAGILPSETECQAYEVRPAVPEDLDHVAAQMETGGGALKVEWTKENGRLSIDLQVPWNTAVYLQAPRGYQPDFANGIRLESGTYHFSCFPE